MTADERDALLLSIAERLGAVETRLGAVETATTETLPQQIEAVESRLTKRIDDTESRLTKRINDKWEDAVARAAGGDMATRRELRRGA